MSLIYENFLKNIKRYPNKIFIYDLKKGYSGKDCLGYLNKIEKFIRSWKNEKFKRDYIR